MQGVFWGTAIASGSERGATDPGNRPEKAHASASVLRALGLTPLKDVSVLPKQYGKTAKAKEVGW